VQRQQSASGAQDKSVVVRVTLADGHFDVVGVDYSGTGLTAWSSYPLAMVSVTDQLQAWVQGGLR
jgi:hypothetical protein